MNDMSEDWKAFREHKKWERQRRKEKNIQAIKRACIPFKFAGESMLFRQPGKPKVDYYPSTGRWRVVGTTKQRKAQGGGDAIRFLIWYRKQ